MIPPSTSFYCCNRVFDHRSIECVNPTVLTGSVLGFAHHAFNCYTFPRPQTTVGQFAIQVDPTARLNGQADTFGEFDRSINSKGHAIRDY